VSQRPSQRIAEVKRQFEAALGCETIVREPLGAPPGTYEITPLHPGPDSPVFYRYTPPFLDAPIEVGDPAQWAID
jgi:hypothetical protein